MMQPRPAEFNAAILAAAGEHIGLAEWPGARHNPQILQMFVDSGHSWVVDDETPWCAAFVNSVLASLGLPHTGRLNARSYLEYGVAVPTEQARPGDIVVLWRNSRASWEGHVAFFVRFQGGKVVLRGGNQGNAVTDAAYDMDRILAVRRADGVQATPGGRPILREGDRGAFVTDLQAQLRDLGYTLGKIDGAFGARTLAAVVAFQRDNELAADGVVGPRTWAALAEAKPREERTVEMKDLRGRSRTIDTADQGKAITQIGGSLAGASIMVSEVQNMVETAQRAEGVLQQLQGLAPSVIAIAAVCIVGWLVYKRFQRIEELRLEDARTGANDRI
jgi:uncharacterized protein (TIGR02594 family)